MAKRILTNCEFKDGEASDNAKPQSDLQGILQKFLNLVETHNLNISVLNSVSQYWTNGQLQEQTESELLLPTNNVYLTESQLSSQVGKQWLSDVQPLISSEEGIPSGYATYRVIDGNGILNSELSGSSSVNAPPTAYIYDNILTDSAENWYNSSTIRSVFSSSNSSDQLQNNYASQLNFLVPGADGQSEKISVYSAKFEPTVVDKSQKITSSEIDEIKKAVAKISLLTPDSHLFGHYVSEILNEKIPVPNSEWSVIYGTSSFYAVTNKWVKLDVNDVKINILAI